MRAIFIELNRKFSSNARKFTITHNSYLLTLNSKSCPPKRTAFCFYFYSASTVSVGSALGFPRYSGSCMPAMSKSSVRGGTDL